MRCDECDLDIEDYWHIRKSIFRDAIASAKKAFRRSGPIAIFGKAGYQVPIPYDEMEYWKYMMDLSMSSPRDSARLVGIGQ